MEGNIDYVRLSDFGTTSGDEVRKALLGWESRRRTRHTSSICAITAAGCWTPRSRSRASSFRRERSSRRFAATDSARSDTALGDAIGGLHPLVVLVNKYTASASEITSGALQDYHLATLIGTRTFGKGVVQSIYPLPDQGALKITTARYVTPAGRDIQHHGIEPDVVVDAGPQPFDHRHPGRQATRCRQGTFTPTVTLIWRS